MAEIPPYPLYNRTYLLYRLSPLHTSNAPLFSPSTLQTHAQRLTSQLKGDTIRGLDLDQQTSPDAIPNLGPLEHCTWDPIGDEDDWIYRHRHLLDPDTSHVSSPPDTERTRGVQVTLEYGKTAYNALLLRDPETTVSPQGFTSLPLLMLKMPAPIREIFLTYLRSAFDTHISPMRLPSEFLTETLESHLRRLTAPLSTQTIQSVLRQLSIQLTFPTPNLKTLEIALSARDISAFLSRGKRLRPVSPTPFTSALSLYLHKHLALNLSHPDIQFTKLTTASFTLGTDRLKLSVPEAVDVSMVDDGEEGNEGQDQSPAQMALGDLYKALVREASGRGRFVVSEEGEEGVDGRGEAGGARDGLSSVSPESEGSVARSGGGTRKRAGSAAVRGEGGQVKRTRGRGR